MLDPDYQIIVVGACESLDTCSKMLRDNDLAHTQLYQVIDIIGDVHKLLKDVSDGQCKRDLESISET